MTKLSPRDQLIAIGLGAALVLFLFIMFLLRPQFGRLGELAKQQEDERLKLEQAKLNLKRLESLRVEAAQTETKLIKLSRRIPEEPEVPSLLIELQDVANAAGLDFNSVTLDQPADKSGYAEIPLTIQTNGSFYAVVDYLYRLEHLSREIVVSSVKVNTGSYPKLTVDLSAKAFRLLPSGGPQIPPPPAQPPPAQ